MNNKRIGKYYVSNIAVRNDGIAPDVANKEFIPTTVEMMAHRNKYEYI